MEKQLFFYGPGVKSIVSRRIRSLSAHAKHINTCLLYKSVKNNFSL